MLKRTLFAMVPVVLFASSAFATDDFLNEVAGLKADAISDAAIVIQEASLDGLDVDGLSQNADSQTSTDAVEACFRNFGYQHCGYHGFGYGFSHCYQPCYTFYQPLYCYRPVHYYSYHCAPVFTNYWGCY